MNDQLQNSDQNENLQLAPVAPKSLRRRWLSRGVFSLVIFACGIVVGIGLTLEHIRSSMASTQEETIKNTIRINPDKSTDYVMKKFQERYTLSEEQAAEIEKVVRDYFVRVGIRRHKMYSEFHHDVEQFGKDISRQLSTEQQKDWDESYAKLRYSFFPRRSSRKHHHGRSHHKQRSKHHDESKQSSEEAGKKKQRSKSENTGSESVPRGKSSSVSK